MSGMEISFGQPKNEHCSNFVWINVQVIKGQTIRFLMGKGGGCKILKTPAEK